MSSVTPRRNRLRVSIARGATRRKTRLLQLGCVPMKTRAENPMIVDLFRRNDLSTVSDPASVRVPVLAGGESYLTVHQLVPMVSRAA